MSEKTSTPVHVAVIMDGNGRWATDRHLPRFAGHRRGVDRVLEIVRTARETGVKVLTLFAFSTENWNRPKKEIEMLMRYLEIFLDREKRDMRENGVRVRVIGRRSRLPKRTLDVIMGVEKFTEHNTVLTLVLAIDYGSRQEIAEAMRRVCADASAGNLSPDDLSEDTMDRYLYTAGLPDPDLLIRTSGEQRLSNFLLWQCSYAEFYFTQKLWPDFGAEDFKLALEEFRRRTRRFGAAS
jgi:undecaprenyl diphosphate synthase